MFVGMLGFLALTHLIPEQEFGEEEEQQQQQQQKEGEEQQEEKENDKVLSKSTSNSSLYKAALITALGISLHNFPEGLIVFNATVVGVCSLAPPTTFSLSYMFQYLTQCTGRGLVVALAIALHNIPEGIAVALPLYYSSKDKWKALKLCLLSSLCEPLAAILFGLFFSDYLTERLMAIMNSMVAGIMVLLSIYELIPTALKYTSEKVGKIVFECFYEM